MRLEILLISLGVGLGAGLIDVLMTYRYEENRYSLWAIAFHWMAVGFLMPFIALGIPIGLKGVIVGVALAVPFMIIEFENEPKAVIPMVIFSAVFGFLIAVISDFLIQSL